MPFNLENFKNQPPISVIKDEDICGLSLFKKRLEQLFFSDVVIRNSNSENRSAKLIIEVSCNFTLWHGVLNLKSGIWAQFRKPSERNFQTSEFYNLVIRLQEQNPIPIEVEEFSVIFTDCSIIINKIYHRSIPEQLDAILTRLADHYSALKKKGQEVPYEVFIPVFEEDNSNEAQSDSILSNVAAKTNLKGNYFNYWGLYFKTDDDARIYNLEQKVVISGELNMLND